jgi:Ca2+-binding RTX toxin-like protein
VEEVFSEVRNTKQRSSHTKEDATFAAAVYYFGRYVAGLESMLFFPCLTEERWRGMRRIVLLLASIAVALLLASGVTLADHLANTVQCPTAIEQGNGVCYGTEKGEHIYGTDAKDGWVIANGGDDQVDVYAGDDYVKGGGGRDTIYGGDGRDSLSGDNSGDIDFPVPSGNDKLYGAAGPDYLWGDEANDFLHGGTEADFINGGFG